MAYLKLKNKKDFVSNFLGPVSNLNDMCVIKISNNSITCTIAASDSTVVCKADLECETDVTGEIILNIPDIKKLIRVLEIVPSNEIELKLNENNISYSKDGYRFKYHILDDGIIKLPNINVSKINNLGWRAKTSLLNSIDLTYSWYKKQL